MHENDSQELTNCPKCGEKLKKLVYGMLAGPPADDEIAAGCLIEIDAPTKACPKCCWQ
jgi:uncharacterized protein (UPF0212 family)